LKIINDSAKVAAPRRELHKKLYRQLLWVMRRQMTLWVIISCPL